MGDEKSKEQAAAEENFKKLIKYINDTCSSLDKNFFKQKYNINLDMTIVKNPANPLQQEIIQALNELPAMLSYISNIRLICKNLLETMKMKLLFEELNYRTKYKQEYEKKLKEYNDKSLTLFNDCKENKSLTTLAKEIVKNTRPKEPTEKDIESYIKSSTKQLITNVSVLQNKYDKLDNTWTALNNKFLSVRAMKQSMYKDNYSNHYIS